MAPYEAISINKNNNCNWTFIWMWLKHLELIDWISKSKSPVELQFTTILNNILQSTFFYFPPALSLPYIRLHFRNAHINTVLFKWRLRIELLPHRYEGKERERVTKDKGRNGRESLLRLIRVEKGGLIMQRKMEEVDDEGAWRGRRRVGGGEVIGRRVVGTKPGTSPQWGDAR